MFVVHGHTDYYGPQLVGVFSTVEAATKAVCTYCGGLVEINWEAPDIFVAYYNVRVSGVGEFECHEVTLDANDLLKINQ